MQICSFFLVAILSFSFGSSYIALSYAGDRATGYGVALLNTLFGSSSQSAMLRGIAPKLEAEPNG